ncbi:superoxide dismutase, Cu-Zn family [Palleronia marisminoris]|uniref:superoxide dismutase family protein n=1 Tax=Palleronia marisminoris TaxID=315423 RepID=UPI0008EE379D|nr:superoxide dismutase family protein [Palleronia marisminoris]SFH26590.1 superoxide dismutase, Cu-Zn family [Palleronia marisminoris]
MKFALLTPTGAAIAALAAMSSAVAQDADTLEAQVQTEDGTDAGTVTFEQVEHGVVVTARLQNLPEGPHGFHIHETGACEPTFEAAGGHYSPRETVHGFDSPEGYHAGDLPNVYVAADGTATADFFAPHLTLEEQDDDDGDSSPFTLRDADGSAIMVHAQIDDYRAETADSTGPRIACGVIVPSEAD